MRSRITMLKKTRMPQGKLYLQTVMCSHYQISKKKQKTSTDNPTLSAHPLPFTDSQPAVVTKLLNNGNSASNSTDVSPTSANLANQQSNTQTTPIKSSKTSASNSGKVKKEKEGKQKRAYNKRKQPGEGTDDAESSKKSK